jgi:hypothetical protein
MWEHPTTEAYFGAVFLALFTVVWTVVGAFMLTVPILIMFGKQFAVLKDQEISVGRSLGTLLLHRPRKFDIRDISNVRTDRIYFARSGRHSKTYNIFFDVAGKSETMFMGLEGNEAASLLGGALKVLPSAPPSPQSNQEIGQPEIEPGKFLMKRSGRGSTQYYIVDFRQYLASQTITAAIPLFLFWTVFCESTASKVGFVLIPVGLIAYPLFWFLFPKPVDPERLSDALRKGAKDGLMVAKVLTVVAIVAMFAQNQIKAQLPELLGRGSTGWYCQACMKICFAK